VKEVFAPAELDRLRRALGDLADADPATGNCAPAERIWRASRGLLEPAAAQELLDHATRCPACAEAWRLAGELGREEPAATARAARPRRWLAVAAAVLLGAALAPLVLREDGRAPVLRDASAAGIHSTLDADMPLPRDRCELRWTPGPPGTLYSVEVADDRLHPLYHAEGLDAPRTVVPAAALSELAPGDRLLWRVEATLPDGRSVVSPTFVVTLADGPAREAGRGR